MPSASKRRKASNKRKQITTTISHSQPISQSQDEERENCVESRVVQVQGGEKKDTDSSNHKKMDESEKHKIEESQKAEFKFDEVMVIESVNVESFDTMKETHDGVEFLLDQRTITVADLEEFHDDNVVLDSYVESESSVELIKPIVDSLTEKEPVENLGASGVFEFKAKETEVEKIVVVSDEKNIAEEIDESDQVVSAAVMDLVSKEIDSSLSVENGIQPSVSKGIEPCLDEKKVVSSMSKGIEETLLLPASDETVALDLPSVEASKGGENFNMTDLPESTENQAYIALPTQPLQRTSWKGCCGLFDVLRRSN